MTVVDSFKASVLAMTSDEIVIAHRNDPEFAENCRLLVRDNNAYHAINHIVNSLWSQL